jgi:hypothetical protein
MVQDFIVRYLTDALIKFIGINVPEVEIVISWAWIAMPFLAAIATLYLYHVVQKIFFAPVPFIRETQNISRWQSFFLVAKTVSAIIVLTSIVGAVLYAEYRDYRVPGPTRFREIAHLSNYELRERAFTVSNKLRDLSEQYNQKLKGISAEYDIARAQYDKERTKYDNAREEYERAKAACPLGYTYGPPTLPDLGNILGKACTLPNAPTPPSPPAFPVFGVDPHWAAEAELTQEEAAAVWEEIHHRLGGYTEFFDLPKTYKPASLNFSGPAKRLEDIANRLH